MGRKKLIDFKPSKYQENIFNFIKHGVGNVVVEACAGSGKTSTLIKSINLIPEHKKILFCAFNKEIVNELKYKVGKKDNVDIKTIHSLGYAIIKKNFKNEVIKINETKYKEYVMNNINILSTINTYSLNKRKFLKFVNNICELIDFCRCNLYETEKDINILIKRHEIDLIGDEINVVLQALKWGKENTNVIDYGDMVWLPNVLYLKTYGFHYDFIFVDEAQDLSAVQRELLIKLQKNGTRYAFFGDENQSIYNFAGADIESFRKLKQIPNTISLPLSISYRCAKNIVKFAQNYVNNIEHNDDGRVGEVIRNGKITDIQDGDMVLCRNNAPLLKLYNDLLKQNKKCYIKGKDIGENLKKILNDTDYELLNVNLNNDGVFTSLYQNLFENRNQEMILTGLDENTVMNTMKFSNKLDSIKALEALSDDITTKQELIKKIECIFSDEKLDGIMLSTIHNAKGLESKNVFIACPSLMPGKYAIQDWEKEQEHNLMYVAFTRAKDKLVFLDENDFEPLLKQHNDTLKQIEEKTNNVSKQNTKLHVKTINDAIKIVQKTQGINLNNNVNKIKLGEKNKENNTLFNLKNKRILKKI